MKIAGEIIEKYGYFSPARNYTVADKDEAWIINVVKGRHYVAKRIPDDKVMLLSNYLAIRDVDLNDKENVIASPDLIACAHGFRLGGIGAGMLSVVSAPDTPCLLSVIAFPADKSRPDHQQRADPRREKIHHIIQLRRGSAEVKILLILISYHRIHGIDCLI